MYISIASFGFLILNIFLDKKGNEIYEIKNEENKNLKLDKEFMDSVVITESTSFKSLPAIYWFTALYTLSCYGSYLPFNFIASGFLTENFFKDLPKSEAEQKAGFYMSIPFAISCVFVPLFGHLVDKFGKRANITVVSSLLGIFGFCSFFFLPPIYGFVIIGFSYSFTATVCWNIISIVVKSENLVMNKYILLNRRNSLLFVLSIKKF